MKRTQEEMDQELCALAATIRSAKPARYVVVDGSQSAHCCFDATVVDTTKPEMIGDEHYKNQYQAVCECFDSVAAQLIADALNKADEE